MSLGRKATVFVKFSGSSFISVRKCFFLCSSPTDWHIPDGSVSANLLASVWWEEHWWSVGLNCQIWSSLLIKRIIAVCSPAYFQYFRFESVVSHSLGVLSLEMYISYEHKWHNLKPLSIAHNVKWLIKQKHAKMQVASDQLLQQHCMDLYRHTKSNPCISRDPAASLYFLISFLFGLDSRCFWASAILENDSWLLSHILTSSNV